LTVLPLALSLAAALITLPARPGFAQAGSPPQAPPPRPQNPSPMVDTTRAHERLPTEPPAGLRLTADAGLARPVDVFLPARADPDADVRVLVHFHGAAHVAMHAAAASAMPALAVNVHLGAGSSVYDRPFTEPGALDRLVAAALDAVARATGKRPTMVRLDLSAFSAGYGAVRALARQPGFSKQVGGVLLLDGLHAGYVPEGRVLADGGALQPADIEPFVALARQAAAGEIAFVVTHSEIFPGTFASTTETTDALLNALGLKRTAVLEWGPLGMQQLSEASQGRFTVLGFAGNTAPDHVDHLHALPRFAEVLLDSTGARR
jgi:peptidoglycan/xylan/chitin deacetylase (PgdA/CDA1 family)